MIHTSYTVGLTTAQYKALQFKVSDVQVYVDTLVSNHTTGMIDEIKTLYTNYKIEKEETITSIGSTAIIESAYSENVIGIKT